MQMSLDGFVEGANGDMSWMNKNDEEDWNHLFDMLKSVDLLLLGRGMWPDYRKYWQEALSNKGDFTEMEKKYARYAEKTEHIVFSKTLQDAGWGNTKIINGSIPEEVAKLKQKTGKDIQIVGGAQFASTLIDAGLVDEYRLGLHPAILHAGKSLFASLLKNQSLELVSSTQLKCGIVLLHYKN